jgi:hypothetical protein
MGVWEAECCCPLVVVTPLLCCCCCAKAMHLGRDDSHGLATFSSCWESWKTAGRQARDIASGR